VTGAAIPPEVDAGMLAQVLARAADPAGYEAWAARARAAGWCRHPVRLIGATRRYSASGGELAGTFASDEQLPDRVLLKACGQRRATRCPTCSAVYRSDAYQLVAAGLRGGKGIPETVANHPAIFATLTAPSFGPVHSTRNAAGQSRRCRPQPTGVCPHGQPRACHLVHDPDDPQVGSPICPDCFDYRSAVVWNALTGELWRRTTIAARRSLARAASIPATRLHHHVRVSFAKVVEYQRRGVVHLHAVIRLDHPDQPADPPPALFDTALLTTAVQRAATAATVTYPASPGLDGVARWGTQLDLRPVGGVGTIPGVVAAYLAKYATKSTDPAGHLDHRLERADLDTLDQHLNPHLARMVRTAWDLGAQPELDHLRLQAWAHTLGFRGHWLTKSRRYSTTFAALRAARADWHTHHHPAGTGTGSTPGETVSVGDWRYAGTGWTTDGDAWLAATAAARHAEGRRTARQEHTTTTTTAPGVGEETCP
jgi:hypothetical protein